MKYFYRSSASLMIGLLFLLFIPLLAQPDHTITFDVQNLEAGPAQGPWMVECDPQGNHLVDDLNPVNGNYAYVFLGWNPTGAGDPAACTGSGAISGSVLADEQLVEYDPLTDGDAVLYLDNFTLAQFQHVNTVNANNAWNIEGQAGDTRVYVNGVGEIRIGPDVKLRATNCRVSYDVPYPFDNPANCGGSGAPITGSGWGVIDVAGSDAAWVAEFDANGTGQLEFEISSISSPVQLCYGTYNLTVKIKPTDFQENLANDVINDLGPAIDVNIDLPSSDVAFNFSSAVSNRIDAELNRVMANQVEQIPSGVLPDGINAISPIFWKIGTTLSSFSTDVTFALSDIPGISDINNLRILKRTNSSASWVVWGDFTPIGGDQITANNVTSFSDFTIGSIGSDALPVELTNFEASLSGSSVILSWTTATEIDNYGFDVERASLGTSPGQENWEKIGFVEGNGNSNSPKHYAFTDNHINKSGIYHYRLKSIDYDGKYEYSYTIEKNIVLPLKFYLKQNHPNPFNPTTEINYEIPQSGMTVLKIYDLLGREVKELVNEFKEAGKHKVSYNADNLSSGIYIYSLIQGNNIKTMKMSLIR